MNHLTFENALQFFCRLKMALVAKHSLFETRVVSVLSKLLHCLLLAFLTHKLIDSNQLIILYLVR
jgi:hypothetical protein